MSYAVKTAISLPLEDFRKIEALRRRTKRSRSEIIAEAVRSWFRSRSMEKLEDQYLRGYRKKPENTAESDALFRAGLSSWDREDW